MLKQLWSEQLGCQVDRRQSIPIKQIRLRDTLPASMQGDIVLGWIQNDIIVLLTLKQGAIRLVFTNDPNTNAHPEPVEITKSTTCEPLHIMDFYEDHRYFCRVLSDDDMESRKCTVYLLMRIVSCGGAKFVLAELQISIDDNGLVESAEVKNVLRSTYCLDETEYNNSQTTNDEQLVVIRWKDYFLISWHSRVVVMPTGDDFRRDMFVSSEWWSCDNHNIELDVIKIVSIVRGQIKPKRVLQDYGLRIVKTRLGAVQFGLTVVFARDDSLESPEMRISEQSIMINLENGECLLHMNPAMASELKSTYYEQKNPMIIVNASDTVKLNPLAPASWSNDFVGNMYIDCKSLPKLVNNNYRLEYIL